MYREEKLREIFAGKRILIAGYGREGKSSYALLSQLFPSGLQCDVADGDEAIRRAAASGYDLILKSPGVPLWHLVDAKPGTVSSQTDVFLQVFHDQVIGITGTKGKSTTSSLIHHLLPGSILAGNIGIPLFDIIDELDAESLVVAELSCHQLEVIRRAPHIAVILNLFQEHLDHYADYMAYKMAKMQIAVKQQPGDHLLFCPDEADLSALIATLPITSQRHACSISDISDVEKSLLLGNPLRGDHNRLNAIVALRVASLARTTTADELADRLASFRGLAHRMQYVGTVCGVDYYDDSISTIPEACIAAVKALPSVQTLILGGFDRGIDYSPLVQFLINGNHCVKNIVFVGAAGRRIHAQVGTAAGRLSNILECDDYSAIVPWCAACTDTGHSCLLSPAAASYDAFRNFEERGDRFASLVKKLSAR